MAKLRNSNGFDYDIVSSRRSEISPKHKDYLVKNEDGGYLIVKCWIPERKEWLSSNFYGRDNNNIKVANEDFKKSKPYFNKSKSRVKKGGK